MEPEPVRVVARPEGVRGIGGHLGRGRDLGQELTVRTPEAERAVGLSIHLVALFVDRAVMPAT